ncbi:MAG TPA: ribosome silencing factor [Bacteroidia bacterium]|nr:ribosome silencing factor [Bacteroidia bacterium]HNT79489.1 ribosome silencing factor [Bacteroidia bacterium]
MAVKKKGKVVKIRKKDTVDLILETIVNGMQEKKAEEIITIDIRHVQNNVADFFLICHAESRPQIIAIADSIEEEVKKVTGELPINKEGLENCEWLILDYFNIVVHIFRKDRREYYGLERLWADGIIHKMAGK